MFTTVKLNIKIRWQCVATEVFGFKKFQNLCKNFDSKLKFQVAAIISFGWNFPSILKNNLFQIPALLLEKC